MRKRDSDEEAADLEIHVFHALIWGVGGVASLAVLVWLLASVWAELSN